MGHDESTASLSPEEKRLHALMHAGDDFLKIEIYRSAIHNFREAAKMNIDNEAANKKVEECKALLQKENRAIYIIVGLGAVIVAMICLIS